MKPETKRYVLKSKYTNLWVAFNLSITRNEELVKVVSFDMACKLLPMFPGFEMIETQLPF